MDTFLINRNYPLRSGVMPKLRHRTPSTMSDETQPLGDKEVLNNKEINLPEENPNKTPENGFGDEERSMSELLVIIYK